MGHIQAERPPTTRATGVGLRVMLGRWLTTPVPAWIPAAAAAVLVVAVVGVNVSDAPLTIRWGPEKGGARGVTNPPLAAEAMLEFLIVPDPNDPGQLAASVAAVETFLRTHPEDLAMQAKLIEIYRHQLALPNLTETARNSLQVKLAAGQKRFQKTLAATDGLDEE